MIWVAGADKKVLGLSAVGDDGNKAARNVQPHSGHLHTSRSDSRGRFIISMVALHVGALRLTDHGANHSKRGELELPTCQLNGNFDDGEVE
jgi:hypothetical protein